MRITSGAIDVIGILLFWSIGLLFLFTSKPGGEWVAVIAVGGFAIGAYLVQWKSVVRPLGIATGLTFVTYIVLFTNARVGSPA